MTFRGAFSGRRGPDFDAPSCAVAPPRARWHRAGVSHPILRLLATDPKRVVGLAPGPHADEPEGIDAALVEVSGSGHEARVKLLRFARLPLLPQLREAVERLLDPSHAASAAELASVHHRLGLAYGEAAAAVAGDGPVDLVGSAGQTVWHQGPWMKTREDLPATSLQIGEAALIAARTGAVTVADFRAADVAVLGEGAPLPAFTDWLRFHQPGRARALLSLGGVTGITVVPERLAEVLAFESGPGALLLDELAWRAAGPDERPALEAARLDAGGGDDAVLSDLCRRGEVEPALLARLLDDDFVRRPPPKAAGRERYGRGFAASLVRETAHVAPLDRLATALAFVVESTVGACRSFVQARAPLHELLVCGPGARIAPLRAQLAARLAPVSVQRLGEREGQPLESDAREAITYALLAVCAVHAQPSSVPAATGARRPAVLGKLSLPPP